MPRIDQVSLLGGRFKKSKVRSWDDDLVNSLKITKDEKGDELEFNKGSIVKDEKSTGLEFNKGSIVRGKKNFDFEELGSCMPNFLDDDFRFRKIIKRLSGHELKILLALLKICRQKDSLKTGCIASEDFDAYIGVTRNSRETALKRLCKKGVIKRLSGKRGVRGTLNIGFVSSLALNITNELYEQGEFNIFDKNK